jgi:hypothetical protein
VLFQFSAAFSSVYRVFVSYNYICLLHPHPLCLPVIASLVAETMVKAEISNRMHQCQAVIGS